MLLNFQGESAITMPRTANPRATNGISTNVIENLSPDDPDDYDDKYSEPDTLINEMRLWPPSYLQAYCLEHFLMECEIYYKHEKERYDKLVAHSREAFLARKKKLRKPATVPTRRQPSRRAKDKHSVTENTRKAQKPPRPKSPSSAPFKPRKLEKEFTDSREGLMQRIMSAFRAKLGFEGSWVDYKSLLEMEIEKTVERLQVEKQEVSDIALFLSVTRTRMLSFVLGPEGQETTREVRL